MRLKTDSVSFSEKVLFHRISQGKVKNPGLLFNAFSEFSGLCFLVSECVRGLKFCMLCFSTVVFCGMCIFWHHLYYAFKPGRGLVWFSSFLFKVKHLHFTNDKTILEKKYLGEQKEFCENVQKLDAMQLLSLWKASLCHYHKFILLLKKN